ncbi:MAG: hypothetical protein KC635_09355 [Myxococcales bacterium]|nr:hypothetical protein [Myxococcales bacterium]
MDITIVDNHPTGSHELEIAASDVSAGETIVYDIQGDNTGHGHTLTVSAEDFATLDAGEVVTLTSSDTGAAGRDHTHDVILSCAG